MQEVLDHLYNVNNAWKPGLRFKIDKHLDNAATLFNRLKSLYIQNFTGTGSQLLFTRICEVCFPDIPELFFFGDT